MLHKTLCDAASINRLTATSYDGVLELLHITEQVPAWSTNQLTRVSQTSKRYIVEPALIGALLNIDRRAVLRSADLTGRLIDTFVMAQLRPELLGGHTGSRRAGVVLCHGVPAHGSRSSIAVNSLVASPVVTRSPDSSMWSSPNPLGSEM